MQERFVFFWGGPFSQWAKYAMVVDGKTYNTCEQYMMAEKARLFGDTEAEEQIMASRNPREQKSFGRKVRDFDEARWKAACEEVVFRANLAKFSQNEQLRDMLLATGDKVIAEASPQDAVWGIGMAEDHPNVTDMSLWGQNLLGKTIMRVRTAIRDVAEDKRCGGG